MFLCNNASKIEEKREKEEDYQKKFETVLIDSCNVQIKDKWNFEPRLIFDPRGEKVNLILEGVKEKKNKLIVKYIEYDAKGKAKPIITIETNGYFKEEDIRKPGSPRTKTDIYHLTGIKSFEMSKKKRAIELADIILEKIKSNTETKKGLTIKYDKHDEPPADYTSGHVR